MISLSNIYIQYGERILLDRINLVIKPGERVLDLCAAPGVTPGMNFASVLVYSSAMTSTTMVVMSAMRLKNIAEASALAAGRGARPMPVANVAASVARKRAGRGSRIMGFFLSLLVGEPDARLGVRPSLRWSGDSA